MKQGRARNSGFTLVELMIVVAILGMLASIALPAFSKYAKKAGTAEALAHLNKIWLGSVAYFEADHIGNNGTVVNKMFPVTAGTFPPGIGFESPACCNFAGGKCAGNAPVYSSDASWIALNFTIADPHRYIPTYTSAGTGTSSTFKGEIWGNLDCDGLNATFRLLGWVNSSNDVYQAGGVYIDHELE